MSVLLFGALSGLWLVFLLAVWPVTLAVVMWGVSTAVGAVLVDYYDHR